MRPERLGESLQSSCPMDTKEAWNKPAVISVSLEALPSCGTTLQVPSHHLCGLGSPTLDFNWGVGVVLMRPERLGESLQSCPMTTKEAWKKPSVISMSLEALPSFGNISQVPSHHLCGLGRSSIIILIHIAYYPTMILSSH